MIIHFGYPSSAQYTGGAVVLYEYANGLARRGHEVHLLHGPATPFRVDDVDEITWFAFHPSITHRISDTWDHPAAPDGDVCMQPLMPERFGEPVGSLQGFGMLSEELERAAARQPLPKVCVARWIAELARDQLGVPAEQLWHVPNAIDHGRFRVEPDRERTVDVAVLVHPHPSKGWPVALEALEALRSRRGDLVVRAFAISADCAVLVPDWIELLVDPGQDRLVQDVYGRARVFLQASYREGFGLTAVEAMACGAALVTTDNGGSRDYARHQETALVAPPGDHLALAGAVEALLDDPARRDDLAGRGERFVRTLTWDAAAERIEAHLVEYLRDPPAFQRPSGEAVPAVTLPGAEAPGAPELGGAA